MAPQMFEGLHPVMHGFQLPGFEVVKSLLPLLRHREHTDLAQHTEMLGDRGLRQPERYDYCPHCQPSAASEQIDDLPPPRLGNGVKDISRGGCTCHGAIIFLYGNIS